MPEHTVRLVLTSAALVAVTAVLLRVFKRASKCVLYYHPISQPSRACLSLLRAAHIPPWRCETRKVALESGEHKTPHFLAINANGAVPAISEGEFGVGESNTCMRFLCARLGLPDHWYPAQPHARARVDEYLDWHHSHTRKGVPFFFHKYMALQFGMPPDTLRRAEGRAQYESAAKHIEHFFLKQGGPWIAGGEAMSIADLACYAELGPMQWDDELGPFFAQLPKLASWLRTMSQQEWHDEVMAEVMQAVQSRRGQ